MHLCTCLNPIKKQKISACASNDQRSPQDPKHSGSDCAPYVSTCLTFCITVKRPTLRFIIKHAFKYIAGLRLQFFAPCRAEKS